MGEVRGGKRKYPFRCECGAEFYARATDVLRFGQHHCKACTTQLRMKAFMERPEGVQHQRKMTQRAASKNQKGRVWHRVYARCLNAKQRCTHSANYAGRGIEFRFSSPADMTRWVLATLGEPPTGMSLDRVDNDGHYEPGNLRWATRTQQNSNKRPYKGSVYGHRIKNLLGRSTYGYESIRTFINEGMTDEEIINRVRHPGGRPRI